MREKIRPFWRAHGLAPFLPLFLTIFICPARRDFSYSLKAPVNTYDEGLLLTLRTFSGLHLLPYRDLWTLYGPGQSLLAPVFWVLGRNLLVHRIFNIALLELFVVILYVVYKRFVGRWPAAVFASIIGLFSVPISYLTTFILLIPGIYLVFVPRDEDNPALDVRRIAFGMLLIGSAFLGRLEYGSVAPLALLIVLLFWWRKTLSAERWKIAFAAGAPGILFVAYLATIPFDRVVENFFRYPSYYPLLSCRGTPIDWHATWQLAFSPLFNGLWSPPQLAIVLGDLLLPALGIFLLGAGLLLAPTALRPLLVFLGACDLIVFRSMWARTGTLPVPALPIVLLSIGALALLTRFTRPKLAGRIAVGTAVFLGFSVIPPFVSGALDSWKSWPPYRPLLGFCERNAEFNPTLYQQLATEVNSLTKPNEPIFVALENNTGHFANAAALYWALDHPPATRFYEFEPCLTDREDIQQIMVRDLTHVRVIVTTDFWRNQPFSQPPATSLDQFIGHYFGRRRVFYDGDHRYQILVRNTSATGVPLAPETVPEVPTGRRSWTLQDDEFLGAGWYPPEHAFGAWSASTEAVLRYRSTAKPAKSLELALLVVVGEHPVSFSVAYAAGQINGTIPATKKPGLQSFTVRLPIDSGPNVHTVKILSRQLWSPADQGYNSDHRKMGVGIQALAADNCTASSSIVFRSANAPDSECQN